MNGDSGPRKVPVCIKTVILVILLIAIFIGPVCAQSLYDPADRLYRHLAIWEQRGYFAPLPVLRPYSAHLVTESLNKVVSVGRRNDRDLAMSYLEDMSQFADGEDNLFVLPITVSLFSGLIALPEPSQDYSWFGGGITSSAVFDAFAYSTGFRYWWESTPKEVLRYRHPYIPVFPRAGPDFKLGDADFQGIEDIRLSMALDLNNVTIKGGFTQNSFGSPLYDGVVIGSGAPPTSNISAVFRGSQVTYTASLMELVAEQAVRKTGEKYLLKHAPPETGFPSKYLMLHSLQWHALPWLSLDVFSLSVFGARLSLYSLLPIGFMTEPFTRDYDNTLAGVSAHVRLPLGLLAMATLVVDDYNIVVGETFNPSPFANKTAGQLAFSWTPTDLVAVVALDYLFVAPYTYTHSSHQPINYLTYTHRKQPIANALEPNSDQLTLAAFLTPMEWLDLELTGRLIRHGNASAQRSDSEPNDDGSIWDDGYTEDGDATFVGPTPFLIGLLEYVYQIEIAATGRLSIGDLMEMKARVSYRAERIDNLDLIVDQTVINHFFEMYFQIDL